MSEAKLSIQCPACQKTITVPGNWQGKRRPCPECHEWIGIPAAAESPTSEPAPQSDPGGGDGAPLSFAERMKQAAERGSSVIKQKEEERARRQAARAQAPTFEEKMRKATGGVARSGPPSVAVQATPADSLAPADLPAPLPAAAAGTPPAANVSDAEDDRRQEREEKLIAASFAPEKIGRISVILCAISMGVFLISMTVVCIGGVSSMGGIAAGGDSSLMGGIVMAFGVCMFGFSPICALCGFFLGIHSLMRSRHTKIWGIFGTVLNGLLMVPPAIMFLVTLSMGG